MSNAARFMTRRLRWLGAAALLQAGTAVAQRPPSTLIGTWSGDAAIVVSWTTQRSLAVRVTIDSAGRVAGRVGDAELFNGHVRPNRGAIARALGWKTDFIITGQLNGPVIAAEQVVREGVRIPFDLVDGRIEGGIHTTGSKSRGREGMALSARNLVLQRPPPTR